MTVAIVVYKGLIPVVGRILTIVLSTVSVMYGPDGRKDMWSAAWNMSEGKLSA